MMEFAGRNNAFYFTYGFYISLFRWCYFYRGMHNHVIIF